MVQQIGQFIAQVLMVKFALNDVPHALGLFDNPSVTYVSEDLRLTAYRAYAGLIEDKFGPKGPLSLEKIYHGIGFKKGLTKEESDELVRKAVRADYIKKSRVRIRL